MTVETNDTVERYTISGVGPYAFSFRVFDEDEIAVVVDTGDVDPVPLTLTTHYTVSGVDEEDGGTITLTLGAAATYAGDVVDIRSNTVEYQPTSIRNQGRFLPEIHEDAFDRLSRQIQDVSRRVERKFGYPDNTSLTGEMSSRSEWAERWVYVNADGEIEPSAAIDPQALTQSIIGALLFPRTAAELAAGVVPVNYFYPEGHLLRYGTNSVPGTTDMASAFTAAIALRMPIHVPLGVYRHNGQMAAITEGGLIGEGWGSGNDARKAQIIFYNITGSTEPAVRLHWSDDNHGGLRFFENIDIRASSWDSVTGANGDGMDITGPSRVRNVQIGSFKRYGLFLHNTDTDGEAPYDSLIENVRVDYSGQHGFVHGTGANSITYINCGARWSGAPSFGVAPSVAGNYDGFYMDYQGAGNPGSAFYSYVMEGISIIGGDCSYNSRYGWNFVACQNGVMQPGYAEGNLQAAPGQVNLSAGLTNCFIALAAISGRTAGVNFGMINSTADLGSNRVFVGGRDCGAGNSNTDTSRTQMTLARANSYIGHNSDFTNVTRILGDAAGVGTLASNGSGYWNLTGNPLRFAGTQVLTSRQTGWTAATGTATRTTFATGSVTLPQLAERVKALLDDLIAHGLIGS